MNEAMNVEAELAAVMSFVPRRPEDGIFEAIPQQNPLAILVPERTTH